MGDENNKISITYETIFELLRREKNRDELQKLNENFYDEIKLYLGEKNRILQSETNFSENEQEKLTKQIQNTKRMIIELFERREKKIIVMSLNKVRTVSAIVDTSSFLPQEKKFFHDAINLFSIYRNDLFESILSDKRLQSAHLEYSSNKKEEIIQVKPQIIEKQESKIEIRKDETQTKTIETKPTQTTQPVDSLKKTKNTKMIRILASIPKFVGKELEVYGPFNPDDMANIPSEIADILIKKGRAEEIKI